jgi:hypothetical protein
MLRRRFLAGMTNRCQATLRPSFDGYVPILLKPYGQDATDALYELSVIQALGGRGDIAFVVQHSFGARADRLRSRPMMSDRWGGG